MHDINPLIDSYKLTLLKLMQLVLEKNKVLNLTTITNQEEFWQKHIIDSLEILKLDKINDLLTNGNTQGIASQKDGINIVDIGTGAGFPGLPLSIVFADKVYQKTPLNLTLVDSTNKKIAAVNSFVDSLSLKGVKTIWARSDDLQKLPEHKNNYDLVLARSVSYLPKLIDQTAGLLKPEGYLACYKTNNEEELKSASLEIIKNKLKLIEKHKYTLGNLDRCIYVFKKS